MFRVTILCEIGKIESTLLVQQKANSTQQLILYLDIISFPLTGNLSHDDKGSDEGERDTGFATVEESSVGKKISNRSKYQFFKYKTS